MKCEAESSQDSHERRKIYSKMHDLREVNRTLWQKMDQIKQRIAQYNTATAKEEYNNREQPTM